MQLKPVKLSEEDIKSYRALRSVIRQAKFELQGGAITQVSNLLMWYDKLEIKLEDVINKEKVMNRPKLDENLQPSPPKKD